MAFVNETWLESCGKLNGERKHVLACLKDPILERSCDKDGVEYLLFLFFRVSVLPTLFLEFDFFYSFDFNEELLRWIVCVKLAESLPAYDLSRRKIDTLSGDRQPAMLIKLSLTLSHI